MQQLIESINQAVIGERQQIETSFGTKPLVYADYTASGRSLDFIENFIQQRVLPYYANTHTETSYTGMQTTLLREQARTIIRDCLNGTDDDLVIFSGPGATAAVNKLIDILNMRLPADLNDKHQLLAQIPQEQRPVVFIGPYEHHSNELPWRETIADVVTIPLKGSGAMDLDALDSALQEYSDRPLKIGSFSAASNVTGLKTDVDGVARLLHKHGALSFWDYAAASPYVGIDMNVDDGAHKDAVFISPHKFIGGPGTPGILVVKKSIISNRVPAIVGGGTVKYVTPEDHLYTDDLERREEGGTPAVVESIRAGLVFQLQAAVGTDEIERREHDFVTRAIARWRNHPNIDILGCEDADRLSIISLQLTRNGKYLHYGFVVALLNDLFGIQSRGGCSCAGPYGHELLGMDMEYSKALEAEMNKGLMVIRPGWVRMNFNYFIDEETFEYLVRAVELVAEHGYKLMPYYRFDESHGVWLYQNRRMPISVSLEDISYQSGEFSIAANPLGKEEEPLGHFLSMAEQELQKVARDGETYTLELPESAEKLRWFALPQDELEAATA
ncbi:aminotransferase class V-fold PLP-dependent enzyme [Porticoccus sp. W117]|uniref:aminotransferase class V-fold PLP-dependent enzyme n=1 Tax=Porticoccus sp. W117 TaxID=3054777 RepID=UPI002592C3B7|nr:aminotransferase class V-fold PLP-dependent enzyme [Porticoccus sp. W117]MDM3870694.1 aminotransferase class V-fold PLP-dependent enzyme [Porticoccus sp. W117]